MNSTLPNYDEKSTSQFSAVKQLINMGYNYLSRAEVRQILQKQDYKNLLEEITFQAVRKINDDTVSDKSNSKFSRLLRVHCLNLWHS